jgi:hypothetical protein
MEARRHESSVCTASALRTRNDQSRSILDHGPARDENQRVNAEYVDTVGEQRNLGEIKKSTPFDLHGR